MSREHIRKLGFLDIYSIATGTMISSGLFVLPAVIYPLAGPAIVVSYALAGLIMVPSLLAKAELSTAIPKSGGTYVYVDRSLGSLMGTFAGFAGWISIALKGAFALVGLGTFWRLIDPAAEPWIFKAIAVGFVLFFMVLNLLGARESARVQVVLVIGLLSILVVYIIAGIGQGDPSRFFPFMPSGGSISILKTAGMVFVAFGGLTKVAAVAGETKNPGKVLPRGMIWSFLTVNLLYILAVGVTVGLLDPARLTGTLTPLSEGGRVIAGRPGAVVLALAALLAFATTANASILAASHNPAAMARDNLLPGFFARENRRGVPYWSVVITSLVMALVILLLDVEALVKTASTMKLILFFLVNLSLVLMRESRIVSYRPEFHVPLYPILPLAGMVFSLILVAAMGLLPLALAGAFFVLCTLWSLIARRGHPRKDSALIRIVERVVAREVGGARLADELGEILLERDAITEDRFDGLIRKAIILDFKKPMTRTELFQKIAAALSLRLDSSYKDILASLEAREAESTTAVAPHLAIPHIVMEGEEGFEIVLVRVKEGVSFTQETPGVNIVFTLAGAAGERAFHLKALMAIAEIARGPEFVQRWMDAYDEEELRLLILLAKRSRL